MPIDHAAPVEPSPLVEDERSHSHDAVADDGTGISAAETTRRDLAVYDEADVAWTTRDIEAAVASGASSFARRAELNFLSSEPGDENLTLDQILDLASRAQDDMRAIIGIDVLEVTQWGIAWVAPGPHRLFAEQPGRLTVADHALVAEVPVVRGARPLTDAEWTALLPRIDVYSRMPNHPSGCLYYDINRREQYAVAPGETPESERIIFLDPEPLFERDSWIPSRDKLQAQ